MFFPTRFQDYLSLSARRFPEKAALIFAHRRMTYSELDRLSRTLAWKLADLGLLPQQRVAIFLDNSMEAVISIFAVLRAGGVFVPLNGLLKEKKLHYILNDCRATQLITHTRKNKIVSPATENTPHLQTIVWVGEQKEVPYTRDSRSCHWDELFFQAEPFGTGYRYEHGPGIDMDLAALIYTSGSTGQPKSVMCPHLNMMAAARSIVQYLQNRAEDILLNVLPLSFDYGLYQVLMSVIFGGTVVLEPSFHFPIRILQLIEEEKVTGLPVVPTILAMLLNLPSLQKYDLSSLRYLTNTGAALPVEHIRNFRALFPTVSLFSMYGLTECKRVSYLPPEELDRRPGSVGKAIPNCEVMILDKRGREVPPGIPGELVVRGANVMRGYWKAPEETAKVFRKDSRFPGETLLYTGDYFTRDEEGYLYFIGRRDDMIKTKGERVSPREVENVICEIEGVKEVAVVGVPDDLLGQAIQAYVVPQPGLKLEPREILRHCTTNLEIFMVPRSVELLPELPRTMNGKVDKNALKRGTGMDKKNRKTYWGINRGEVDFGQAR